MGKITIYFIGGDNNILPNINETDFEKVIDFFNDNNKTNIVLSARNGIAIYPKDKILYVLYETYEEE